MTSSGVCSKSRVNPAQNLPARRLDDTEPDLFTLDLPGFQHREVVGLLGNMSNEPT